MNMEKFNKLIEPIKNEIIVLTKEASKRYSKSFDYDNIGSDINYMNGEGLTCDVFYRKGRTCYFKLETETDSLIIQSCVDINGAIRTEYLKFSPKHEDKLSSTIKYPYDVDELLNMLDTDIDGNKYINEEVSQINWKNRKVLE